MTTTSSAASATGYPGHHVVAGRAARPAIVMEPSGITLSYGQLDDYADRLSHLLRSAGLEPGDSVAICMENRVELLAICWGAHYAGLRYTAISSRLTAQEVAYIVGDCGAKAVFLSPAKAELAGPLRQACPAVATWYAVGGPVAGLNDLESLLAAQPARPLDDRVDGVDMLYSSGTTGKPKGVKTPLTGKPLGTHTKLTRLCVGLFRFGEDTVYLSPAPLYHAAPLRFCMVIHRLGGTAVVMEQFDPALTLELIERHRVTAAQFVPTMFIRLLRLDPALRTRHDLSSLRCAIHAAAPCPVPVKEQMIDWWGPVIHEYYAGTEGNGLCHVNSQNWLSHKGTVGRPLVGTLHILDEDGRQLPPGEAGTVYFSGGGTFEYHNDPEGTQRKRRGAMSTLGDVGRLDEDGFLYLTDRRDYMIISGGVNIYPQEAENLLALHPDVEDVAVFGVPHPEFGEEVKAVVQPTRMPADDTDEAALSAELIAYCRQHLADLKCPRSIDFRSRLPRHPTGKLYKRLLRDEYWPQR